ncbi:PREDICTED: killer cell lectin-like receptor subfamily B member 1B allele A [Acanthisitta chloris]|uniref:killer cell lectin-like receptor subfamily B member 1B allele A n=1 Tax=Acanthisitta chloris TaxID=57068 RepID=UPI0004F0C654|nr:PREDICTED: killer cell lectin-like receptor subfamily B member 1B allele A [Acanthisitta chloris]
MAGEIVYADLSNLGDCSSPAGKHHAPPSCPWWHRFLLKAGALGQLILLVLVVVLSIRAYVGCKLCPQDWQLHGERCYWLSEELGNWTQGTKSCENQDSQLVVLQDKKEKEHIKSVTFRSLQPVWIGLRSQQKEWRWVDNTPFNPKMFGTLKEMEEEGCGTLKAKALEVNRCDAEHKWVCKKKPFLLYPVTPGVGEKCVASI